MAASTPITAYQPVKAFYIAGSLLYWLLLRVPVLAVYFAIPSNRPDPTWSLGQAIGISTARFLFTLGPSVRFAQVWKVERHPKDPNKAFVPAAKEDQLQGPLIDSAVKPADLMGDWYPAPFNAKDGDASENKKVLLFMFGGAYVMGNGSPKTYTTTLDKLLPAINAKIFIPSYRLAGSSGGQPFPSQLQDLLSSYLYLINDVGVAPKNIILVGESAGGNAVAAFLLYLAEHGSDSLPSPAAALLSSPWVDMTEVPYERTKDPRYQTDMVAFRLIEWGQQAFIPDNRPASDKYISPVKAPFRATVPVWLEAGGAEVAVDSMIRYAEGLKSAGTDVEVYVAPHGTHVPMWAAALFGFDINPSVESFVAFLKKRAI